MKTLDEIVVEAMAIDTLLTECAGELTPELEMKLGALMIDFTSKAEAYQHVAAMMDGRITAAKQRRDEYAGIARVEERKLDRLKERLAWAMATTQTKRIDTPKPILLGVSRSVEVTGPVPEAYRLPVKPTEPQPDKEKIKVALDAGETVENAKINETPFARGL